MEQSMEVISVTDVGFTDLPEFIIQRITRHYLSGPSIAALAATCKWCHDICSSDIVWKDCCQKEYVMTINESSPFPSFKDLYTRLLHPYGWLIGFWCMNWFPYGGLIKIKFFSGSIVADKFLVPRASAVKSSLKTLPVFEISKDADSWVTSMKCILTRKDEVVLHSGELAEKCDDSDDDEDDVDVEVKKRKSFLVRCKYGNAHRAQSSEEIRPFWVQLQGNRGQVRECKFKRIEFDVSMDSRNLYTQGVFKGTYGAHGIELIYIHETDKKLQGLKISGDPNVPAGEVSFRAVDRSPRSLYEAFRHNMLNPEDYGIDTSRRFHCRVGSMDRNENCPQYYRECGDPYKNICAPVDFR